MPSSSSWTDQCPTWRSLEALWGSCSLISQSTIQPAPLGDKLGLAGVNQHLTSWILDYLTNQPQYVRTRDYVSDTIICSTGAPQGTVLAPFLFTLYTADFYHQSPHCHLQKFSDDSAIVGLIRDGMTEPTENLFRTLWTGASGTTSSSTPGRPKSWWWISAGTDNPAHIHTGNRHWDGDISQVPGSSHEQ